MLLRLTESEFEALDVAAHLDRMTPNAYAYELLRNHVASLKTNDHIQQGLELLRSYEASKAATTPLGRTSQISNDTRDDPAAAAGATD